MVYYIYKILKFKNLIVKQFSKFKSNDVIIYVNKPEVYLEYILLVFINFMMMNIFSLTKCEINMHYDN
ncbi:LOW QUALITY PROTEIN: hypothetical protein KUTeg_007931 [Tegillarca granosa]|uniref:Uncharacterized protein n=1 Tax=Tegillarca granosa TaxID=220873 RepID=A0ABQ9FGL1_TEGGR|nr:LOW QUALITY PROTEIN: hypothetical protein KUTeg_007931 [Tegillarca granosa]